ncbi:hypothetical protein Sango_0823400 [Sesamum angolense]|uniref:3'-5' exonuclease domain-containing protein n=1 Tax=Sesamum angolense TaxID=2727404 RepID=A0AAE1X478_9LAMI|nr:hypothetical protein Sango_0823400 [Sesamum angolense]
MGEITNWDGFGEDINNLHRTKDMGRIKQSLKLIPDQMIIDVKMFGPFMEDRIHSNMESCLIVTPKGDRQRDKHMKITKNPPSEMYEVTKETDLIVVPQMKYLDDHGVRPSANPPHHSPNPAKLETYTVICHSHRVHTVVTAKPAVVREWVHKIRYHHRHQLRHGRLVVGLGVQWVPGHNSPPATLQLCVGHHCLIFQLLHAAHSPAILRRFLSEPGVKFVGVWNYRDASMLRNSKHRLHISQLVDVRVVASDLRGCSRGASMESLAAKILGMDGVKKEWVGRSAWDETWLSQEQVEYALC